MTCLGHAAGNWQSLGLNPGLCSSRVQRPGGPPLPAATPGTDGGFAPLHSSGWGTSGLGGGVGGSLMREEGQRGLGARSQRLHLRSALRRSQPLWEGTSGWDRLFFNHLIMIKGLILSPSLAASDSIWS